MRHTRPSFNIGDALPGETPQQSARALSVSHMFYKSMRKKAF